MLILHYVLPKGIQRLGDYGFLRGNSKATLFKIMTILCYLLYWLAQKNTEAYSNTSVLPTEHVVRENHVTDLGLKR